MRHLLATVLLVLASVGVAVGAPGRMVSVGPGELHPLYAATASATRVKVDAFALDRLPVTNAEFLSFVRQHPSWQRDRIARVLADDGYLAHWAGPEDLG